jgi:hypothetical protein
MSKSEHITVWLTVVATLAVVGWALHGYFSGVWVP